MLFQVGKVQPAPLAILVFGCVIFAMMVLLARLGAEPSPPNASQRDRISILGIILQGVGISMASGPTSISSASLISGLFTPRALAVAALMVICVGLFRWASIAMGRNWAIVAQVRPDHQLITDGPFAYVRNPIYLALLAFMLAVALATGHEAALVFAIPVYLLGTAFRVAREEKLLFATFGPAYDEYARRVKRLVPWVI